MTYRSTCPDITRSCVLAMNEGTSCNQDTHMSVTVHLSLFYTSPGGKRSDIRQQPVEDPGSTLQRIPAGVQFWCSPVPSQGVLFLFTGYVFPPHLVSHSVRKVEKAFVCPAVSHTPSPLLQKGGKVTFSVMS